MRRVLGTLVALAALLAPAGATAAGDSGDLDLVAREKVSPRLVDLRFETPAMADGTANARVLLPPGYSKGKRDYPVLWLLHGASYDESGWTTEGDAQGIVGKRGVIVVMPNGGRNGYYTDWFNDGAFGPPAYETFHIGQLLPWIDRHFRTRDTRGARAIAGFSMGGFGAMSYAARHPDLFAGAYSFSGAIDTNFAPFAAVGEASSVQDGGIYGAYWGLRADQEVRWRAKNPWDLATNLEGMTLQIRTGNGNGGGPFGGPPLDIVELGVNQMAISMDARLDELGLDHVFEDYGPGAHQFPYYERSLERSLPAMMRGFRKPPAPPRRFEFRAVEPDYAVYGYEVEMDREALEFSELDGSRNGKRFSLRGSGDAEVSPPPLRPRSTYTVRVSDQDGREKRVLRTDRKGRLTVALSLGASNREQQFTAAAAAAGGTKVRAASVSLKLKR
jgi:S-formylglutathione hydrolase FrmB